MKSFIVKMIKGALIGSGFIIPGVSGGTLAMVFGVYERLIMFLANIRENFKENIKYFIPIGLGAILGISIFSGMVSFLLGNYAKFILWFFVGAIVGNLPSLWQESGKYGREGKDLVILGLAFIGGLILLNYGADFVGSGVQPSFLAWIICGVLIALGLLIPGLSSSNFIVYMGLYKDMADGFANFDFSVIIPIGLGGLATIVLLIKLINKIYERHYTEFFHFIIGIVLASTVMIVPRDYAGFAFKDFLVCLVLFVLGVALSLWMARLEEDAGGGNVQEI